MNKYKLLINDFFSNYKKDFIFLSSLLLLFIIIALIEGPIYGDLFIDSTRESYVPELMLRGKVLHKDIFTLYNPLSYLINSIFYLIFGAKFKVLYAVSYVDAFFVISAVYLICRQFISEFYSFIFSFVIMSFYVFGNFLQVVSYIYPYSYGFSYAATCFLYSTLIFLFYMKTNNKRCLYGSFLMLGFTYANKPEFLLCMFPAFAVLFLKKEKFKAFIISFVLMILPTLVSYGILYLQGMSGEDLKTFLVFCRNFFNSQEQIYFNTHNMKPPLNIDNINKIMFEFKEFFGCLLLNVIFFKLFFGNKYAKFIGVILAPLWFCISLEYFTFIWSKHYNINFFSWQIFLLAVVLFFNISKLHTVKDKMLFFLAITGILSMSRIGFMPIHKSMYGVFFLLPLTALWIYFINSGLKIFNEKYIKQSVSLSLISISVFYLNGFGFIKNYIPVIKYESDKGTIYGNKKYVDVFKDSEKWVRENTNENESILVLPEGVFLNHITGRPTKPMFYQLTPNHISTFGEEYIVKELDKDKPDYMAINNYNNGWCYGKSYMCIDFGHKICDFIYDNYAEAAVFTSSDYDKTVFIQVIYKLKGKDK